MPNYSNQELQIINAQRFPDAERPSYYSSRQKKFLQISRDFEAYLILQTTDSKEKTTSWISRVSEVKADNKDRDDILERYLTVRKTDADAVKAELDEELGGFIQFKSSLFADAEDTDRWSDVGEIQQLIAALQSPMDELALRRELTFHESTIAALLLEEVSKQGVKTTYDTELNSWLEVINLYPGLES